MDTYLQERIPPVKGESYPRETGALLCDSSPMETKGGKRARGRDIRPPSITLEWNQAAFARRVRARVDQLNATMEGLAKKAGGRGDEIRKSIEDKRKLGPTATSITFVATALSWTIGQAMGTTDPTLNLRREQEIDPRKLQIAIYLADLAAEEISGESHHDDPRYARMVSTAYSWVSEREAAGRSIDTSDPVLMADVKSLLRHL